MQWASLISSVQQLTPQRLQGRLMGAVESLGAICPAIGFALGGAIAVLGSPRTAFLVAGVGATLSTAAFLRLHIVSARADGDRSPRSDVGAARREEADARAEAADRARGGRWRASAPATPVSRRLAPFGMLTRVHARASP